MADLIDTFGSPMARAAHAASTTAHEQLRSAREAREAARLAIPPQVRTGANTPGVPAGLGSPYVMTIDGHRMRRGPNLSGFFSGELLGIGWFGWAVIGAVGALWWAHKNKPSWL